MALDPRVTCSREVIGKRFLYTVKAHTKLGEVPGQARFSTPLYTPPPKPPEPEPAPDPPAQIAQ